MLSANATDAYFRRFNDMDVRVRACGRTPQDCQKQYLASIRYPTSTESTRLQDFTTHAKRQLLRSGYHKLLEFPTSQWKILVFPSALEGGFPHTHGDTILLPDTWILSASIDKAVQTLIHERIHIYQRYHPMETNALIQNGWNLTPSGYLAPQQKARANPDTNHLVYATQDGCPVMAQWPPRETPRHLGDTTMACALPDLPRSVSSADHPYELMAYILADLIVRNATSSMNPWERAALSWMQTYLT